MVCVVFSVICSLLWILRMFIAAHLVFSVTFTLFVCVALHTTLYDKALQHTPFRGADFTKPLENKGEAYLVGATTYAERVSREAENRGEILYLSS